MPGAGSDDTTPQPLTRTSYLDRRACVERRCRKPSWRVPNWLSQLQATTCEEFVATVCALVASLDVRVATGSLETGTCAGTQRRLWHFRPRVPFENFYASAILTPGPPACRF